MSCLASGLLHHNPDPREVYEHPLHETPVHALLSPSLCGTRISNVPTTFQTKATTGCLAVRYTDDFYNRIHVTPAKLDLGNIIAGQERQIEVWNAHFVQKTLDAVTVDASQGLELNSGDATALPPPVDYAPLQSRIYNLSISATGAARVDTVVVFTFGTEVPDVEVTGTRAIIFPFLPNWARRNPGERFEFLTDVITTFNKSEQRIRLRKHPRRQLEYTITLVADEAQLADATVWGWQGRPYVVPVWMYETHLQTGIAAGSSRLDVDTTHNDFEVGGLAILRYDSRIIEAVEISEVNPDHLLLAQQTTKPWIFNTPVYPGRPGRLQDNLTFRRTNPGLREGLVRFLFQDRTNYSDGVTDPVYLTHSVLEDVADWNQSMAERFDQQSVESDPQVGDILIEDHQEIPKYTIPFNWYLNGRDQIHRFKSWLYRQGGRQRALWVPTGNNDLTVVKDITATDSNITVRSVAYSTFYNLDEGRQHLLIQLRSGEKFYRRIVGSGFTNEEEDVLTLNQGLGLDLSTSDIYMISFLVLSRLEADSFTVSWHTPTFALVRGRFVSVLGE